MTKSLARAAVSPPEDLQVAEVVIDGVAYHVLSHPLDTVPPLVDLTRAEREIAARLVAGWSQAEIAAERGTSPRTVAKQVELLDRKVGVRSRAELLLRADEIVGTETTRGAR